MRHNDLHDASRQTRIRWGIIGCGDVTEVKSGPAFSRIDGSKLVAVMRRNGDLARDYAERHGVSRWYDDADRLIADPDVDAVYVATPPDSHAKYAIRALQAGKPVYVEKPMARTFDECVSMVTAAEATGLDLLVAYYRRQLPSFVHIKKLVDDGAIGDIRMVRIKLLSAPGLPDEESSASNWRVIPEIAGGGYFVDLASHQFDFLDLLFGPVSETVGVATNQARLYRAEDTVSASWRHESGVVGVGSWCFCAASGTETEETEIVGSKGCIRFSFFGDPNVRVEVNGETCTIRFANPKHIQQPLIETVVDHLLGRGTCASTGQSAARTTQVLETILAQDAPRLTLVKRLS